MKIQCVGHTIVVLEETKKIQKLATKPVRQGLGREMRFKQRPNHKKSSVYYRLGKHQRMSRPQNYITRTPEESEYELSL